jgi:alpha-amylase/alpha-mannosidase (GH57 family)
MSTTLILHGHFYQPPREAPDTDIIPIQHSAYPSADWNERINKECYAANAYSRYLTYDGRVDSITNNYEYLSFNFGPTLLHWLLEHDRSTYERIIAADKASVERLGHGNAIAQSFNHTILPLDSKSDARTQIIWGLKDFVYHFGRKAEGIWLPEAAVNMEIIDQLIDEQIKFIILSPWQAEAVESKPGKWKELGKEHAPYDRAYRIKGSNGEIAAFFYNPDLAQGISFGHYLQDADTLYDRLLEIQKRDDCALLHSATDGEIFGHHEPFGDMCLAALAKKVEREHDFELSNYGTFLEDNPPELRARLRPGEEQKGSSWSCFHGVSRWYKDCGCSTGGQEGWNQKWRTPLRKTFNALSDELISIYRSETARLTDKIDPEKLLLEYGDVTSGHVSSKDFALKYVKKEQVPVLLQLLEGQRFRMYTFTSCGWFFADLSGIEPVHNIRYALQAIDLYQEFTDRDLTEILSKGLKEAKSNILEFGSGHEILVAITPSLEHGVEAASYFALNRLFAVDQQFANQYGAFSLISIDFDHRTEFDLSIEDTRLAKIIDFHLSYVEDPEAGIVLHVRPAASATGQVVQVIDLPERLVTQLYQWIDESLSRVADNDLELIASEISNYFLLVKQGVSEPNDEFFITNMGTCLRALHSLLRQNLAYINRSKLSLIEKLLRFIEQKADERLKQSTGELLNRHLAFHGKFICHEFDDDRGSYITQLLALSRRTGFAPEITSVQNCLYRHLTAVRAGSQKSSRQMLELAVEAGMLADDLIGS